MSREQEAEIASLKERLKTDEACFDLIGKTLFTLSEPLLKEHKKKGTFAMGTYPSDSVFYPMFVSKRNRPNLIDIRIRLAEGIDLATLGDELVKILGAIGLER